MHYIDYYISPLGVITLASDGAALTGLWFEGQRGFAHTLDPVHEQKALAVFDQAAVWLKQYFNGEIPAFTPPLKPQGTPFQQAVWTALLAIPYGKTVSYSDIAARISLSRSAGYSSARAVGSAVGRNPVSLIIPCHRVIGASGSLTGYAGGIWRKQALLTLEKSGVSSQLPE